MSSLSSGRELYLPEVKDNRVTFLLKRLGLLTGKRGNGLEHFSQENVLPKNIYT